MQTIKYIISVISCILICGFHGYPSVTFKFAANSIDDGTLKDHMEDNISALLTEINSAEAKGTSLNLSEIDMDQEAKNRLIALWNDSKFICDESTNISKCLQDCQGYQVRAVPITMKPQNASCGQSLNRELTISLNKNGAITGARVALNIQIAGDCSPQKRLEIQKWIEDLYSYYTERNIDALNKIFNLSLSVHPSNYITIVRHLFKMKSHIFIDFDDISITRHVAISDIYGVTLHQCLRTDGFEDEEWLFTIWNFNDPEKPQILLSTWQTKDDVAKNGLNTLNDFFIP